MHILVVEDNEDQALQIKQALEKQGFTTSVAHDGEEALFLGETVNYDAVVLDVGLPIMDGIYVLRKWRKKGIDFPVLILSTRDAEDDRLAGWSAGCEAYVGKPFLMWELVANLRALIKSASGHGGHVIECGELSIDLNKQILYKNDEQISLSRKPFQLIQYLLHHQNIVVSKDELLDHLYGWDSHPETNTIEVFIRELRNKIGDNYIMTKRGFGYVLNSPESK